jgi:hypothetical protein
VKSGKNLFLKEHSMDYLDENQWVVARKKGKLGAVQVKDGKPVSSWKPEGTQRGSVSLSPEKKSEFFKKERETGAYIRPEIKKYKPETKAQIDARVAALKPREDSAPAPSTKPPVASAPTRPAPAAKPAPQPKIEKSPAGYAVGSVGGVKFERRAATSAELAAAREARDKAKAAGQSTKEQELSAVKAGVSASKKPVKEETMKYDAYDLVLEYLFSQGHVDTLDEAHYVMMVMDAEVIQDIVSEAAEPRGGGSAPNVPSSVYKFVDELPSKIQGFMKGKPAPAPKPATK